MSIKQWPSNAVRRQWKMLHLLYLYGKPGISYRKLWDAGVDCQTDAIDATVQSGMTRTSGNGEFELTSATTSVLALGPLGYSERQAGDFRVDYPSAFVIMPYREPWETLWKKAIEPAAVSAGLECYRADESVRVGDLNDTVWTSILAAGLIVADVSEPNPNVFYELGLATAIGKDVMLLKARGVKIPADLGGALYYEYDLNRWAVIRKMLTDGFTDWSLSRKSSGVQALYKS